MHKDAVILQKIMNDIKIEVDSHGVQLDLVMDNSNTTKANVIKVNQELKGAAEYQKGGNKRICCMVISALVVAAILLIIIFVFL